MFLPESSVLFLLLLSSSCMVSTLSRVSMGPDGGYRGIVVKIDSQMDQDYYQEIIDKIKAVFTESSSILSLALSGQAHYSQVLLVVPGEDGAEYPGGEDILVTSEPGTPHTVQYGQCGVGGEKIVLPYSLFYNTSTAARLLVAEWAKYRYGVYDEHGYPGSILYPNYYISHGSIYPTGTTNALVTGSWLTMNTTTSLCDPTVEQCYFRPEGPNTHITCSLGYVPLLPSVTGWCDHHHARHQVGPGKHAVLCGGRSVPDVIFEHKDFKTRTQRSVRQKHDLAPVFDIVRQPLPRYVLLIETSRAMSGVWKWVRKACQNLVKYELPDNTEVAIVTFNNEAVVGHNLTPLTSERVRSRLADTIPDSPYRLSRTDVRCVICGVKVAMDQVLRNREAGGHLIILTSGDKRTLSEDDKEMLSEYSKYYNIRVSSILLPAPSEAPLVYYNTIATQSGGRSRSLYLTENKMETLSGMIDSLVEIIGVDTPHDQPVTVHHQAITRSSSWSSQGQFIMDTMLGRDTVFGIFVEDDENHQIKSVMFTDEEGSVFGPYTKMSSVLDGINLKTINFPIGEKPPFDEAGGSSRLWKYNIDWYKDPSLIQSIVIVRSKHRDTNPDNNLDIQSWTNFDSSSVSISSSISPPLTIFTQVMMGRRGVVNAKVSLSLQLILNNGTRVQMKEGFPLLMTDNGFGDPDLVSGDGIYSRYLTTYPFPGKYVFTITVSDNSNTAYVGNADGSNVPLSQRKATGLFSRTLSGPVVDIAGVEGGIVFPPAKIGDLSAVYDDANNDTHLLLSWTTPSSDHAVTSYHLLYSPSCDSLLLGQDSDSIVFYLSERPGVRVEYTIDISHLAGAVYVGLIAEDSSENISRISNLVYVNITTHPPHTENNTLSESKMMMLGIVVGIIMVITLSLLTIITCWLCHTRLPNKQESLHGFKTRSSGVNVDISSSAPSSDTSSSKLNNNLLAPPKQSSASFGANITPTYWSASQLLADHENRTGENKNSEQHQDHHLEHCHPSDHLYHLYNPLHYHGHFHEDKSKFGNHHHFDNEEHIDDYGSDLVDEALKGNRSEYKSDLDISDETSSTLPMLGLVSDITNTVVDKDILHRNITQV